MITKDQAITARNFEHVSAKNADGTALRARASGQCKVWVKSPERFKLPVKYGLYQSFYIEETNASEWIAA